MRKTTAWVLFLALFVAYSNLTEAQTNTTLSRHATKIKHKVTKLGVGASVIVVRDSGPNVKGTIQAVEDSTFTVTDTVQNQPVTLAYENVKQLDTYGTIVATGAKPHNPHKSLIIGACVLGGLIVFLAVALSDKKF
jgi:hypothetical protein